LRHRNPDNIREETRKIIGKAATKNTLEKRSKKSPKLLRERTIKIAEERWEAKQVRNRTEVRRLNAEFRREARKDKERLIKDKYHHLEEKNKRKRPRDMFRTIRELAKQSTPKTGALKGKAGELITEKDKNLERRIRVHSRAV
jgi:hypothetical protein